MIKNCTSKPYCYTGYSFPYTIWHIPVCDRAV